MMSGLDIKARAKKDPRKGKYATPDWLYYPLNRLLRFDLDAAASSDNARCRRYFTQADNALAQRWKARCWWCNPPYGQEPGTGVWVAYGIRQILELGNQGCMLLPVKADTAWYHDLVWGSNRVTDSRVLHAGDLSGRWYQLRESWGYVELLELRGRVDFEGLENSGFFASAVVLLNAGKRPVLPRLSEG